MGSGVSRPAGETSSSSSPPSLSEQKQQTNIDTRIVSTLQELSRKRQDEMAQGNVKPLNFERIVLKFGVARCAFDTIQELYDEFANEEKEGLEYEGLKNVLKALGAHMQEQDVQEIFYESDMVRDNSLSFNEFVVSLAISYLLGLIKNFEYAHALKTHAEAIAEEVEISTSVVPTPVVSPREESLATETLTSPRPDSTAETVPVTPARVEPTVAASIPTEVPLAEPETIQHALELMVMAYLLFDTDGSGTIQIREVRQVMQRHSGISKNRLSRKNSSLSTLQIRNERIKELDLNHDGSITFQEFVLTFQRWIGGDNK